MVVHLLLLKCSMPLPNLESTLNSAKRYDTSISFISLLARSQQTKERTNERMGVNSKIFFLAIIFFMTDPRTHERVFSTV